jgi:hypothetical protein
VIYSAPIRTLAGCDGRYPTLEEESACMAYAASLPARLRVADLISQKEAEIVRYAIDHLKRHYPRFAPQHDRAWEKASRDMTLHLRYAVQAMVVDDLEMPKDKLYVWITTIVRGTGHTPQIMRDGIGAMVEACQRLLPADAMAIAEPYLHRMVHDLSDFPEPMKPAVD